jgi:hypothetical protein
MTPDDEEPLELDRQRLRCFVIGPIGSPLAEAGSAARANYEQALQVLEQVILPACNTVGLEAVRGDGLSRAGEITEQIFRRLRDDDVVIADLTGANANVMYELGLRHTRNALTIQIGEYGRLPFDITVIRTVQFLRTPYGLIQARNDLIRLLEAGLAGEYDPVTATRIWAEDEEADAVLAQQQTGEGDQLTETDLAEPLGFVDLLAAAEDNQGALAEATSAIGQEIPELGRVANTATQRTAESDAQGAGMRGRLAVLTQYAHEVDAIADQIEADVTKYEVAMASVSAGNLALIRQLEQDPAQLPSAVDFLKLLRQMASRSRDALESQSAMITSLGEATNASQVVRRPVRRVAESLDRFAAASQAIDEWDRHIQALGVPVPPEDWEFPGN